MFITKMNKLVFYTDFLSYRMIGRGMTGLGYKAFDSIGIKVGVAAGAIKDLDVSFNYLKQGSGEGKEKVRRNGTAGQEARHYRSWRDRRACGKRSRQHGNGRLRIRSLCLC